MLTGVDRFDAKLMPVPECGCWLWTGAVAGNGYGSFREPGTGRRVGAHKFAYETVTGRRLRRGLVLLHKCDTPLCCNPMHHRPGRHKTNMADMARKGRAARRFGAANHQHKHSDAVVARILKMAEVLGMTDALIAFATGIPRSSVTRLRRKALA